MAKKKRVFQLTRGKIIQLYTGFIYRLCVYMLELISRCPLYNGRARMGKNSAVAGARDEEEENTLARPSRIVLQTQSSSTYSL